MKAVFLTPMLLSFPLLWAAAEEPPLGLRVEADRPQWEVNERTGHVLKITNQSSRPVTVPSFRFMNGKGEDQEIAFYLDEHVLKMQVMHGAAPVAINAGWQTHPEKPRQFPTVELRPNDTLSVPFSLTAGCYPSFYSLTEPGEYTLTVILDTTGTRNDKILKGRFVSPPVRFRILPIATFRTPGATAGLSSSAHAGLDVATVAPKPTLLGKPAVAHPGYISARCTSRTRPGRRPDRWCRR